MSERTIEAYVFLLPEDHGYMVQEVEGNEDYTETFAYDALSFDYDDSVLEGTKIYKTVISLDNAEQVK